MGFSFDWGWSWDWRFVTDVPTWLILLLNVGAVYRLSRVIARDSLTDGFRSRMSAKYHGALINLMLCMWCLSFWFGLLALFLTAWQTTHDLWLVCCYVLTLSTITGYMSERA
jgi:hypothetical protein